MTSETAAALNHLPEELGKRIALALEPLDRMGTSLDQVLSIQRQTTEHLIREAMSGLQKDLQRLSHDRIQRSLRMAQEQHRKALAAKRAWKGWKHRADEMQIQIEETQAKYETAQKTWKQWMMATITLSAILIVMFAKWLVV
jgi:hypothetical protein